MTIYSRNAEIGPFVRRGVSSLSLALALSIACSACVQPAGAQPATGAPVVQGEALRRASLMIAANIALSPDNEAPTTLKNVVTINDADVVATARHLSDQAGDNGLHYDYFRFLTLFKKARAVKADKVDIPAGNYHLYSTQILPGFVGIIEVTGLSHVVIDGHGANLLFAYYGSPIAPLLATHPQAAIRIAHSDHVTLQNIVIDFDEPLAVPIVVHGGRASGMPQTLTVDRAFPIDPALPMPLTVTIPFDVSRRTFNFSRDMTPADRAAWNAETQPSGYLTYVCPPPVSNIPTSTCFKYAGGQTYAFGVNEHIEPMPPSAENFLATVRDNSFGAIIIDGASSYLTLSHLTIYSSPGTGIGVINAGAAIRIAHCRITRKPDALLRQGEQRRFVSTLSDGLDIITSGGDVVVENSEIGNVADDGINIRSDMRKGQAISANTIRVTAAAAPNFYRVGELVDVVGDKGRTRIASGVPIAAVTPPLTGQNLYTVVLQAGGVPMQAGASYLVRARDWDSKHVVVRNTWIHDNSERGIVVHGSDVMVLGNRIERTAESAIEVPFDDTSGAPEGPVANNVVIAGNIIHDVNVHWFNSVTRQLAPPVAIAVYPTSRAAFSAEIPVRVGNVEPRRIVITDNVLDSLPGAGILVSQADDVVLERNRVLSSGRHQFGQSLIDGNSIIVEQVTNLHADDNVADGRIVMPAH